MSKLWEQIERKREIFVNSYYTRVMAALNKQIKPILASLNGNLDSLVREASLMISDQPIQKEFEILYGDVGTNFAMSLNLFIKGFKDFRKKRITDEDLLIEWLRAYSVSETAQRIVSITETSKTQAVKLLKQIITEGLEEGLSTGDIARKIENRLPRDWRNINTFRAGRIARTEVLTASSKGAMMGAEATGLTLTKVWMTAPRGVARVQERHTLVPGLNGQRVLLRQPFNVSGESLRFPGDPSPEVSAENVINCNCSMYYEQA